MLQLKLGVLLKRFCYEVETRIYGDFICLSCILTFRFVHWYLDESVNESLSCLPVTWWHLVYPKWFVEVFRSLEVVLKEVNIWENGIETCMLSCKKRITSLGLIQGTGRLGLVHWDDPERWYGEGGGRGVRDWELMYTRGGFMSMCGKNQYSIVK